MSLVAKNIYKQFDDHIVAIDVALALNPGDRAGLIGDNGTGKSTLLKILAGMLPADSGEVFLSPNTSVGYLPQALIETEDGRSLRQVIDDAHESVAGLEKHMRELELLMAEVTGQELEQTLNEYGNATEAFEIRGGYEFESRTNAVLAGLGLDYIDQGQRIDSLSGGERARAALAITLLASPDVLLLDEPTNHLDAKHLEWLENFLGDYRGAVLVVTHDREFLDRTCNTIYELDSYSHTLKKFSGNYAEFSLEQKRELERWKERYEAEQDEIRQLRAYVGSEARSVGQNRSASDNDKHAYNARGSRVDRAVSRKVKAARVELERRGKSRIPRPPEPIQISASFEQQEGSDETITRLEHVSVVLDEKTILSDISIEIDGDTKLVIVGPNGSGKTTLLRILAGEIKPSTGERWVASNVKIGYLAQEPLYLDLKIQAHQYLEQIVGEAVEGAGWAPVRYGLLRREDIRKPLGQLSLGQRRRLEMARLILEKPNLLLLDEPTNHISLDAAEAFEAGISEYGGPVIAVSHDRRFVQNFIGESMALKDGRLMSGARQEILGVLGLYCKYGYGLDG